VLRIYEHDASLCQKEIDLIRLVGTSVPVPEVIHAEPRGFEDLPPFALMRYVESINFHELKRSGDRVVIGQAAYSVGKTLASIGRATFPRSGWLAPGPSVAEPLSEGAGPLPRFVGLCLESSNLRQRMQTELRDRVHALVWAWAPPLRDRDDEACLVHGLPWLILATSCATSGLPVRSSNHISHEAICPPAAACRRIGATSRGWSISRHCARA
jgi:aminoglycoside phosphotransferase (APT) family kinase protein